MHIVCHTSQHVQTFLILSSHNVFMTCKGDLFEQRSHLQLASFPVLPLFFCSSVCVYTEVEEPRKTGKPWEHLSCEWHLVDVGGPCPSTNSCAINDRASFLLVKSSTVDLMNVWGPDYCWNTQWWSLVHYLNVDPSPPCPLHVHQMSFTW